MMRSNAGGYYPSPYGSTAFSAISNGFGVRPSTIPPYYQSQAQQFTQSKTSSNLSFKLYDLDTDGQTEIIRLILAYAGVFYKDKRFKEDEWDKIKAQMSFEQLPILRINNHFKIFHLHAIVRYLARELHLYGTSKYDHTLIDIILEILRPFQEKIFELLKNPLDQEQKFQQLITDHSTNYLNQLEKCYEIFNRHGPFYLGSNISLADLMVYDTINHLIRFDPKLLENYSHLKEARRRLEKHPKIKNYYNTKTNNRRSLSSQRPRTKSPTPNVTFQQHHHHHRHRSHDGHRANHHHHHHHHHRRHHSKEPTPLSQIKRSIRSPSISQKESSDIIPPPPPLTNTEPTSESTSY